MCLSMFEHCQPSNKRLAQRPTTRALLGRMTLMLRHGMLRCVTVFAAVRPASYTQHHDDKPRSVRNHTQS